MDEELDLEKLRRRDPGEFTRFVEAHQRIVMALCQSQGLSHADSGDAAAEVFSLAYRGLPNFRGQSRLSTWLYRIAHRTIVRFRGRLSRHQSLPADLVDASPNPQALSQSLEINARIWSAVARLEPDQSAAVELFYRQGWSVESIAGILEKPENSVKTLLHRARLRLRQLLSKLENTDA